MGRRRIGKTELARQIMKQSEKACYLFTSKTAEPMLVGMWQDNLLADLGLRISGRIDNLKNLFNEVFIFKAFSALQGDEIAFQLSRTRFSSSISNQIGTVECGFE